MIARERTHRHRVAAHDADRARSRGGRFRRHDGAYEHAVVPILGLIHQRSGLGASAAEHDGGQGHALGIIEFLADAGAVARGSGETGVGMRALDAFRLLFLRPGIALPVDGVLGRIFIQPFPPHGIVFEVVHDVGEDRDVYKRQIKEKTPPCEKHGGVLFI